MPASFLSFISRLTFIFFLALFLYAKFCALICSHLALPVFVIFVGIACFLHVLNKRTLFIQRCVRHTANVFQKIRPAYVFVVCLALHFAIRLISIFVFQVDSTQLHDAHAYIVSSGELLNKGYLEQYAMYFYLAPHQFWFAHFLLPALYVSGESNAGLLIYLALISTASSYFLAATVYRQISRAAAYAFMLLFALLPGTIISGSFITHEHALIFWLSLFIWIRWYVAPTFNGTPVIQFLAEILSFIPLIVGAMVNGAGLVAIIATIIIYLATGSGRLLFLNTAKIAILILLYLGSHHVADNYHISRSRYEPLPDQIEQYKWVLYIGAHSETWGQFSGSEFYYFNNSAPANASQQEIEAHHNRILLDRYTDLAAHPGKLIGLLSHKAMIIWGTFSHPQTGLLHCSSKDIFRTRIAVTVSKLFMYGEAMLAFIVAILAVLFGKRPKNNIFYVWCSLFLCGASTLLLITECSSKYTISLQPFMYIFFLVPCLGGLRACMTPPGKGHTQAKGTEFSCSHSE